MSAGCSPNSLLREKSVRHAVSVSGNGRITFEGEGADALRVDLEDYH